nr:contractile injection system tape measure protein [Pseudoalteromonas sp. XMcav2-N]
MGQCLWLTEFDEQAEVSNLQDALSQWSRKILPQVLNQVLDRVCPSGHIWRIEQLSIDLGTLQLEELDRQLPQRVAAAIEEALLDMLRRYSQNSQTTHRGKFTIVDPDVSQLTLIRWFLLYGVTPWWVTGNNSPLHAVDQQISLQPNGVAALIRDVGKAEVVRRRIVWQWGEERTRKTVQILEPWNAQFICSYADNMLLVQRQPDSSLPADSNLQTHLWYWILTHLLVDRGTLFNTLQFVRATLWQLAQHYQLPFSQLLEHMSDVARQMQESGLVAPQFLQVLISIQQNERQQTNIHSKPEQTLDLWSLFSSLLKTSQVSIYHDNQSYHLTELFTRLAQVEPDTMAAMLKQVGQSESVRTHIVKQFNQQQLEHVVSVVAPHDQQFVLAHVAHTQTLLQEQHLNPDLIWRVLLAYLLVNKGSYFNRKQFVHSTLLQMSQHFGVAYHHILLMLVQTLGMPTSTGQQYELFTILAELQDSQSKKLHDNNDLWIEHYHTLMTLHTQHSAQYLKARPLWFNENTWQRALRGLVMLRPLSSPRSLYALLKYTHLGAKQSEQLSQKLVAAMAGSGLLTHGEIVQLLTAISPRQGMRSARLVNAIRDWQKLGTWAWGLGRGSIRPLLESVVFSLISEGDTASPEKWFSRTTQFIAQRFGLSHGQLIDLLAGQVATAESDKAVLSTELTQLLLNEKQNSQTCDKPLSGRPELVWYSALDYAQIRALTAFARRFSLPLSQVLRLAAECIKNTEHLAASEPDQTSDYLQTHLVQSLAHSLAQQFVLPVTQVQRYLQVQLKRFSSMAVMITRFQQADMSKLRAGCVHNSWYMLEQWQLSAGSKRNFEPARQYSVQPLREQGTYAELSGQEKAAQAGSVPVSEQRIKKLQHQVSQLSDVSVPQLLAELIAMHDLRGDFSRVTNHPALLHWLLNGFDGATQQRWVFRLYRAVSSKGSRPVTYESVMTEVVSLLRTHELLLSGLIVKKALKSQLAATYLQQLFQSRLANRWFSAMLPETWQQPALYKRWCLQLQVWLSDVVATLDNQSAFGPFSQVHSSGPRGTAVERLFWMEFTTYLASQINSAAQLKSLTQLRVSEGMRAVFVARIMLGWCQTNALNLSLCVRQFERYWQSAPAELLSIISTEVLITELKRVGRSAQAGAFTLPLSEPATQSVGATEFKPIPPERNAHTPAASSNHQASSQTPAHPHNTVPDSAESKVVKMPAWEQDLASDYLQRNDIKSIFEHWLHSESRPHFIAAEAPFCGVRLFNDLLLYKPGSWVEWVQPLLTKSTVQARVVEQLSLGGLLSALSRAGKLRDSQLNMVEAVYTLFKALSKAGLKINEAEYQQYLTLAILRGVATKQLTELDGEKLFGDMCWQLIFRQNCQVGALQEALQSNDLPSSPHLLTAIGQLRKQLSQYQRHRLSNAVAKGQSESEQPSEFPISVPNAGLVLLQSFIQPLFARLSLTCDDKFVSDEHQRTAVHYLQFLVTGQSATEEHHLVLNKLICGHGVTQPVEAGITLSQSDIDTVHSLIDAVCNYWPAIGKTSIDGFRGNWLVRNGTLTEALDHWDLIVEKRVYDILISRSPLSYSIVKLPWMEKPIYVTWPT